MPFRGNFQQHFPPDFQQENNVNFYAPNNENPQHDALLPHFANGTGLPGHHHGFTEPQPFPHQMFPNQPEFASHMSSSHQHRQHYPVPHPTLSFLPPPSNNVHPSFVSVQQQQQQQHYLYPNPQHSLSHHPASASHQLPPTLSSFLPFPSSLNCHGQALQNGSSTVYQHLTHHQPPPQQQQYQFHADMSFSQQPQLQELPPLTHSAQPVSGQQGHLQNYNENTKQEHKTHAVGNVLTHKIAQETQVPVPVHSPYSDATAPKAVPPPTLPAVSSTTASTSSVQKIGLLKNASKKQISTSDPDFYDPDREIEHIQKLEAKFSTEHKFDSNDRQSNVAKHAKEEQPTQPKKLPVWIRQSLENAKELKKPNKKQKETFPISDHDKDKNEVNLTTKLDEKDKPTNKKSMKLTQRQFDEMIMMHTRTLLTELLLSTTNDTIQNTCKTGISKKEDVNKLKPKKPSSTSSSSSRSTLIASTKPSIAKISSGSETSNNSFSSVKESSKKAEVARSTPSVSGVPVVSNIIASTYLAQLSGHYGSSSDEESEKDQSNRTRVEDKKKTNHLSSHSSHKDYKKNQESKSKTEHGHRHTSSDANDRYRHRENDRKDHSLHRTSRERYRNRSRSRSKSKSRKNTNFSSSTSRHQSSDYRDREQSRKYR